ncbi:MAG: hypothetical protein M1401_15270 [Chloroflexi bacterium]|nr:hypothetical protein [Chloroflexota bacterium]MCL5110188.1 hypothetical protein [Chloroflexota bacterium]
MQVDRVSFLFGLVFGLALATLTVAASVMFAPRDPPTVAAPQTATVLVAPTRTPVREIPSPTATRPPSPTPMPTPPPLPTNPPARPTATPLPETVRHETVEVPPRRQVQLSIAALPGQTLDLAITVDSDVDLTIVDPGGTTVYGPQRIRRSYSTQLPSSAAGNFTVKLDNSFSIISTKQVLVQYRLLNSRP